MSMIHRIRPKHKPARVTPRPATEFGQGILPARRQRFEPSAAEVAWAAAEFGNAETRDWDIRALESAALDSQPYGAFV